MHWPDPLVPIQETAAALARLLKEGKIRAIGVSNYSSEQMAAFREVAPIHSVQPPYNLFEREAEADVLPYAAQHDIAVLCYGALCRGLLAGNDHSRDASSSATTCAATTPSSRSPGSLNTSRR